MSFEVSADGRTGAAAVSAVEPSASFAAAARERWPEVDIRRCGAEQLPFPDGAFDVTLAQLVVHFMADPVAGLREMAGLEQVQPGALTVSVRHPSFEQWWERFMLGVGPAGDYVATLTQEHRDKLRERCRHLLPDGPVEISATAWTATGRPAPAGTS